MKNTLRRTILSVFLAATFLTVPVFGTACNPSMDGSSTPAQSTPAASTPNESTPDDTPTVNEEHIAIVDQAYELTTGSSLSGTYSLEGTITSIDQPYDGTKICLTIVVAGREDKPIYCYQLKGQGIELLQEGDKITVAGTLKNYKGTIEFDKNCELMKYDTQGSTPDNQDPYANMSAAEFYANYTVAKSNTDAYYRTKHGFMSGELTVPDQAPTLAANQPKNGDMYIRNSEMLLSADGKTYTVVDCYGDPAFNVYRDGAYITLEEVAAYVYAFGTYPKNHTASKNTSPAASVWGQYLRLNHTQFSGDTRKYPYEPALPNITGIGGTLTYYEMDIGTTGTDCDPGYMALPYNNGSSITRGAARIVYGKNDLNKNGIYEYGEFHVFYTYNHYNDFQEYLNYKGGWGEKFGNITGGGLISDKYNCNPTAYVEIAMQTLPSALLNA